MAARCQDVVTIDDERLEREATAEFLRPKGAVGHPRHEEFERLVADVDFELASLHPDVSAVITGPDCCWVWHTRGTTWAVGDHPTTGWAVAVNWRHGDGLHRVARLAAHFLARGEDPDTAGALSLAWLVPASLAYVLVSHGICLTDAARHLQLPAYVLVARLAALGLPTCPRPGCGRHTVTHLRDRRVATVA